MGWECVVQHPHLQYSMRRGYPLTFTLRCSCLGVSDIACAKCRTHLPLLFLFFCVHRPYYTYKFVNVAVVAWVRFWTQIRSDGGGGNERVLISSVWAGWRIGEGSNMVPWEEERAEGRSELRQDIHENSAPFHRHLVCPHTQTCTRMYSYGREKLLKAESISSAYDDRFYQFLALNFPTHQHLLLPPFNHPSSSFASPGGQMEDEGFGVAAAAAICIPRLASSSSSSSTTSSPIPLLHSYQNGKIVRWVWALQYVPFFLQRRSMQCDYVLYYPISARSNNVDK